jgi:hypothetical protein
MPAIFARLRNHIITGFIFVMPVLVTVAVIMKFWVHLLNIGGKCSRLLRVDTVEGPRRAGGRTDLAGPGRNRSTATRSKRPGPSNSTLSERPADQVGRRSGRTPTCAAVSAVVTGLDASTG